MRLKLEREGDQKAAGTLRGGMKVSAVSRSKTGSIRRERREVEGGGRREGEGGDVPVLPRVRSGCRERERDGASVTVDGN